MKSFNYKDYDYALKRELQNESIFTKEFLVKIKSLLDSEGFKRENYKVTNGTISINFYPENITSNESYYTCFQHVTYIKFFNSITKYTLGYEGYDCFGSYIATKYLENYSNKYPNGLPNGHLIWDKKEEWEEFFLKELKEAIKKTTIRISKHQKVQTVKTRIQNIENEIDYVIINYVKEHPDKGLIFETRNNPIQSVAVSYTIKKVLDGYGGFKGPHMIIRKGINGKYTFCYKNISKWDSSFTNWLIPKEEMTEESMQKLLNEYFDCWLDIPNIVNSTFYKLDWFK